MYSKNKLIQHLIYLLKLNNIRKIVVSPGSRHFPLSHSLDNDGWFELYSVVDERSAAFFALGLIQESGQPVAICCSSGTSVLNYGSAVSEAFYQKLPLLLLTADRTPEYLGQKEDQMLKQDDVFHKFIKYHGQLPLIKSDIDEWYCNRIINEALIELNHHGKGPVQINYPILEHRSDTFEVNELPPVRKISLFDAFTDNNDWDSVRKTIQGKRVMIVWGQSVDISDKLYKALDNFVERFGCVILTDRISNCLHKNALTNAFMVLKSMSIKEQEELAPDVIITLGGNMVFNSEIKAYVKTNALNAKSWQVGPESVICDTFRNLTEVFEMTESYFFEKICENVNSKHDNSYFGAWKQISLAIQDPQDEYNQISAIGKLINKLPKSSVLHLSNSNAIRIGHLFNIDYSIKCFCNRGVNGIDGCMSTAVGYAAAANKPIFLVVGDLTFFYDMNALWNRHLSPNLRILLVNNEGGAVMHLPLSNDMGSVLTKYTSAGHKTSAEGWVKSLGIKYAAAHNTEDLEKGISQLVDMTIEGPILLEVFTVKDTDAAAFKKYLASINRVTLSDRAFKKAGSILKNFIK